MIEHEAHVSENRQHSSDCEAMQKQIVALLDGEMPPHEAARVREHLADCEACAHVQAECRALRDAAHRAPSYGDADLWSAIEDEVSASPEDDLLSLLAGLRGEMRALREEAAALRPLREEVAALRRELAARPGASRSQTASAPSTALDFPYAPPVSADRYRLV